MSAASKFQAGVAMVMKEVIKGHQLQIHCGDVEGHGPRVFMTAGEKGVMMGAREARHLAGIYSSPAAQGQLAELAQDLREAADMVEARARPPQ